MIIPEVAVRKRTSVVVMAVVIIIFGVIAYVSLPRESAPDITIPFVFVKTDYPGVAPEDIEQQITIHIEKKLKGLESVKKIKSSSTEGLSSIVIEFVAGTDIDDVLIYALYPTTGMKFLRIKHGLDPVPEEMKPRSLEEVQQKQAAKAKAAAPVSPPRLTARAWVRLAMTTRAPAPTRP